MQIPSDIPKPCSLSPSSVNLLNLMSEGLLDGRSMEEVNRLRLAVRSAANDSHSKYKPKASNRTKPKSTQKVVKGSSVKQPVADKKPAMPKLESLGSEPSPATNDDDTARLSAWLEFHTPINTKIVPYPVSRKDKARCIRAMNNRNSSRASINAVKAVGVTPRKWLGKGKAISNEDICLDYQKEVINRYLLQRAMEDDLAHTWYEAIRDKAARDQLTITHSATKASSNESVDVADQISRLEAHLDEKHRDKVLKAEAKIYDEHVVVYEKCFAKDPYYSSPSIDDLEHEANLDQRDVPCEIPMSQQIYDQELNSYLYWLAYDAEKEPFTPLDEVQLKIKSQYEIDQVRYAKWLTTARALRSLSLRNASEKIKSELDPAYAANFGIEVHPLYQINQTAYNSMIRSLEIAMSLPWRNHNVVNTTFKDWIYSQWWKDQPIQETVSLAEKLVAKKLKEPSAFTRWSTKVDSMVFGTDQLSNDDPIELHESSREHKVLEFLESTGHSLSDVANDPVKTAEVVALDNQRNKRKDEVADLTSKFKLTSDWLNSFTTEELRAVSKFMDMVANNR